jgi:hypothetical protein
MKEQFKIIVVRLSSEIRKDLIFFASSGVIVGLLMVWQSRLKEMGVASGESWADALFSDFVSFNAFSHIFVGLMAIGSFATIVNALGCQWPQIEATVVHLESRFVQLASSIISFTVGVSISALLHSVYTVTVGGATLAFMIVLFNAMLFIGFVSATLVARRTEPFDRWWVSLLMLLLALGAVIGFIIRGVK